MNSDNKQIRDVADVAARIMAGLPPIEEELKGGQVKLDKNHNGKLDGQDFKILKGQKKEEVVKEDDTGYQDRYAVKNGKAVKHNPEKGEHDEPHHVWADSAEHAVRKHASMNKPKTEQVESIDEATYNHKKAMQSQNPRIQKKGIGGAMDNAAKRIQQTIKDVPLNSLEKRYKEEVEIEEESHQSKTTMKHIPNASPALKQAAKDIKPGVGGYRDRIDMLKAGGVKEEVEQIDEVKMADLPSTKVQGRSYGASKPQPSAFDVLKGPKDKELTAIDAEKKKKKISEMIAIYKEGGLKTFFESIKKEDLIIEEPDSEQFAKDLEDAKKRAAGTKPQADVAKASVQAVKQEAVEQDIEVLDADLVNGFAEVNIQERTLTAAETDKKEHIVKSMKKGMAGFKERYGDRAKSVMYATATKQAKKD